MTLQPTNHPEPHEPTVDSPRQPNSRFAVGRILLGLTLLAGLTTLLFDIWTSDSEAFDPLQFVRRPSTFQTRDDAELLGGGWIEKWDNSWEVGKNHERVRSAFSNVVSEARKSTVRVFRGKNQVAMGTVVDANGYILTKASEVAKQSSDRIICQLYDGRRRTAKVVGVLPTHDLAMLKVRDRRLIPVHWDTDEVPTVGSLLATPHLGKAPLAIGVVSLTHQDIARNGKLGVALADVEDRAGVRVQRVVERSGAAVAGIEVGDIVLRIDNKRIADSRELRDAIERKLPGDAIELAVRRGDEEINLSARLGRAADLDQENLNFQNFIGGKLSFRRSGFDQVVQHDTFLLPEHCGGPVVDLDGRVVGINIARAERIASYALPASAILPMIKPLMAGDFDSQLVRTNSRPERTAAVK